MTVFSDAAVPAPDGMVDPSTGGPVNWAQIAEEAAASGFGVPNTAATADEDALPPRIPMEPGKRGRGRPRKDSTASATPTATPPPKDKPPLPPYREGMFVQPLEEMYGYIGMGLMLADPVCGNAVIKSAHDCAVSLDKLAKSNHAVRRTLVMLSQTSAIGQVMIAHLPILTAVALHHVPAVRNMMGNFGENLMQGAQADAAA